MFMTLQVQKWDTIQLISQILMQTILYHQQILMMQNV